MTARVRAHPCRGKDHSGLIQGARRHRHRRQLSRRARRRRVPLLAELQPEEKVHAEDIYFIGSLSSDALARGDGAHRRRRFSVNVISKSGTTTEPAVAFRFFREKCLERNTARPGREAHLRRHDRRAQTALKSLADQEGYEEFVVPDNIGGRTACSPPLVFFPSPSRALIR